MFTVAELMTPAPIFLDENDSLREARRIMETKRVRHLPVATRDGRFVGLLTQRDLLSLTVSRLAGVDPATQEELDTGIPVREAMRTRVAVATPETPVREAALAMLKNKFGCLPVLDGDRLVGILTEADFVKLTISLTDEIAAG
ncbi:CBS domain-containing protein [Desulfohalovibrio reitneri]|uniref:CBS domain-containing protein n=1 Tax=Desulfohalovibrio reitneri TaxID=1307759 RepID=UPI0004A78584|nr:CBS domain-containing protein [Desulfohalovibrio reitneri]